MYLERLIPNSRLLNLDRGETPAEKSCHFAAKRTRAVHTTGDDEALEFTASRARDRETDRETRFTGSQAFRGGGDGAVLGFWERLEVGRSSRARLLDWGRSRARARSGRRCELRVEALRRRRVLVRSPLRCPRDAPRRRKRWHRTGCSRRTRRGRASRPRSLG